jgi:hypothetical protein
MVQTCKNSIALRKSLLSVSDVFHVEKNARVNSQVLQLLCSGFPQIQILN